MAYYIKVVVNRPSWELLDDWDIEFRNYTNLDPDKDPKAQLKRDIWNNYQHIFRLWKKFETPEDAYEAVNDLTSNLSEAEYTVKELRTKKSKKRVEDAS